METEPEIYRFKGSGNGTVHPATVSWKKLFRRGDPWTDLTAKSKTHLSKDGADFSKEETDRDTGIILFLSISDGSTAKKTEKIPSDVPMKMRMQIWWQQKRDSIRWAVWKDTIWYRVLQKVK